jgi:N-acetylmuramoyl-L-alanine amidase
MNKIIYSFFICISFLQTSIAQSYLKVKAQKGDGIYVLLGRYGLDRHSCNLDQFCKLNKLKHNSYLIADKTYSLPIQRYIYNGTSIRSTTGIEDWHIAKQIERYNEMMCLFRLKNEDFRSGKKELWCPYHFKACIADLDKFVPTDRTFEIFGKNYEKVPLKDKNLAGAVYYLVSGHGGPDPGAMAVYNKKNICEDEYAYDITLRLARNLLEHGAIVYLITRDEDGIRDEMMLDCDEDETCWGNEKIPAGQKERLTQRSDAINTLYRKNKALGIDYQRTIEIHVDSRNKQERIDLFFYYYPQSVLGKGLADKLHKVIQSKYAVYRRDGSYSGDVSQRDLHTLREVIPTTVFIELANIQNKFDQKRILLSQNRQALADWLAEGLQSDY